MEREREHAVAVRPASTHYNIEPETRQMPKWATNESKRKRSYYFEIDTPLHL